MSSRFMIFGFLFVSLPFLALSAPLSCNEVFAVNNLSTLKVKVRESLATHADSVRNRSQLNETDVSRMSVIPLLDSTLSELSRVQGIIRERTENLTDAQNSKQHDQQILEQSRARLSQLQNRLEKVKSKMSWFDSLYNSKGQRIAQKIQKKIDSKAGTVLFFGHAPGLVEI